MVLVFVVALLPYAGLSLRRFTLPSFFLIFYVLSAYIGLLPLYFHWSAYPISIGVVDKEIILKMFFYSSMALFLIVCGFIYAHQVIGIRAHSVNNHALINANSRQRLFMYGLLLLCGIILMMYVKQLEAIALFKAMEGDLAGAQIARSNMGNAFAGKYWRYHLFFRHLLDYCTIYFLSDLLISRRKFTGLVFLASFLMASFSATMAIEKGPFVILLIMLYLSYVVFKGGKYWQPLVKYVGLALISFLLLFYVNILGIADIDRMLGTILNRIFTGQMNPAYFYLDMFPLHVDYLWGASFPNPGGFMPFDSYPLTTEVSKFMFPGEGINKGIVGSAPTVFWGEMHANFGAFGVLFSAFFVGIGLFIVSHVLVNLPLSPPVIAATVFLSMHYRALTATGLSSYFVDVPMCTIAIITFICLLLKKSAIFKKKFYPQ